MSALTLNVSIITVVSMTAISGDFNQLHRTSVFVNKDNIEQIKPAQMNRPFNWTRGFDSGLQALKTIISFH